MTKADIEISVMQESEAEAVNDFYNFVYKENRSLATFRWEFMNAPAGKAVYVIAKDAATGRVVGTQCAIPIILETADGRKIRSAKSEDTLVDPSYRGLSIFERMYDLLFEACKADGILYIWGFTSAKKPFSKLGFEIPFDHSQSLLVNGIGTSYRYLSKLNTKNTFVSKAKIAALCIYAKCASWKRLFVKNAPSLEGVTITHGSKNELIDIAQAIKLNTNQGFWIHQDLPFLTWRLRDNPYYDKIVNFTFGDSVSTIGNVVFNHHKDGVWYLIQDTYAASLTATQRDTLLNRAIQGLRAAEKGNVKLIRTWDFAHNAHGLSEIKQRGKLGFIHLDRGISFVWKNLDPDNALSSLDFQLSRIASQGTV